MTDKNSAFKDGVFDMVDNMVDNGSISPLKNEDEIKSCLLEANRILKQDGLLELVVEVVDSKKFKDSFYSGNGKIRF